MNITLEQTIGKLVSIIYFFTKCNQFSCSITSYFYNEFVHLRWETLLMLKTWCSEQLKFEWKWKIENWNMISDEWSNNLFEYIVKQQNE